MGLEYKNIGIIGAGAAGSVCAYFLIKSGFDVTLFDYASPLLTLLPTGGGRCNLAHADYDFKALASNYPRGEKFLYSVFSKFGTNETIELFNELGVNTYTQTDGRIFPQSNSSKEVRTKLLNKIKNANFIKEKVIKIIPLNNGYSIRTNCAKYFFSDVVIAVGGGNNIKGLDKHNIIPYTPSLVGLNSNINNLNGITLNNVYSYDIKEYGDIIFTHFGISGPLTYKISSIKTRENFPYTLCFKLIDTFDLQYRLEQSPHKELKNILSEIFPLRLAKYISGNYAEIKGYDINKKIRDYILNQIQYFKLKIEGTNIGNETVTAGGYDLNQINSKTMESKLYKNLYIIGEALDIDGFCGGYNLQNAWSTAFIASDSIINSN